MLRQLTSGHVLNQSASGGNVEKNCGEDVRRRAIRGGTTKTDGRLCLGHFMDSSVGRKALVERVAYPEGLEIAVILPCHDEEASVGSVVRAFADALPNAAIFVLDNASTDGTRDVARRAGATVIHEPLKGKGNAVRRAFAEIDADIYVIADGDGTYDASSAGEMIDLMLRDRLDMVAGVRQSTTEAAFRQGHQFGNRFFNWVVGALFGRKFTDILSGYRVLSRRFVKSFPAVSEGFEIETELTVHALQLRLPMAEIDTPYQARVPGSQSKLRTVRDGLFILWRIAMFARQYKPFFVYASFGGLLMLISCLLGVPVVVEYMETGLVPRLPTAVLATGIMLLGTLSVMTGLILHNLSRMQAEVKRLHYLGRR